MVQTIFAQGFNAKERQDQKDVDLLEMVISHISSPFELVPSADLVLRPGLDATARARLVVAYARAINAIQADDRSFSIGLNAALFRAVGRVAIAGNEAAKPMILRALRFYLVRHLTGSRCAEASDPDNVDAMDAYVRAFNRMLQAPPSRPDRPDRIPMRLTAEEISPISQEEQKPSRVEGKMQLYFYWQTPAAAKLGEDLARLRHGSNEHDSEHQNPSDGDGLATVLSEQQRSTEAWEATLRDFLNRFEHWRRDHDEPPAAYFHMASAIIEQLIDLIPNRTLRGAIVRDFIAFLSQSPLEIENPPEWFLETRRLLGQVDLENEIRATGDRVMNLYLDLRVLSRR